MRKEGFSKFLRRKASRLSRKFLIRWIRFSHEHRNSHRLPVFLFGLLTLDGLISVIPGMPLLIAAVTISPRRWVLFGSLFTLSGTLNNAMAYFLGRWISPDAVVWFVEKFHAESLWHSAERALHDYGPYAAFIGVIVGLPTQFIMILIALADTQLMQSDPSVSSTFLKAILLSLLAHAIKGLGVAGLTRFGWVRLEKKFESAKTSR